VVDRCDMIYILMMKFAAVSKTAVTVKERSGNLLMVLLVSYTIAIDPSSTLQSQKWQLIGMS